MKLNLIYGIKCTTNKKPKRLKFDILSFFTAKTLGFSN